MGKITKYKKVLKEFMECQTAIPWANAKELKSHLIINKDQSEFILLKVGWFGKEFKHSVIFHFEIKNNKVWLYKNNTDIEIGELLVDKGIPKSNIVIGFISEMERTVEGYALA